MANAFQDQLLKAGLVTKDKVNRSNKKKYKQAKQQSKNKNAEAEKLKEHVKQATMVQVARDQELNRQKVEEDNKKSIAGQIKQLVEMNRIPVDEDGTAFNFEVNSKIERIFVTDDIREQLVNGRLAIVSVNEKYEVVPKVVADKIMQRDTRCVVLCNEAIQDSDGGDEYADYKVPDDLMW